MIYQLIYMYVITLPGAYLVMYALFYDAENKKFKVEKKEFLWRFLLCQGITIIWCWPFFAKIVGIFQSIPI